MHDPLQAYQALGACSLGAGGYGLPYPIAQTPGFYGGIPQIPGLHPFAGIQSPLPQSPFQQNPLAQLQNPLAQLQNPLAQLQNPLLAQLQNPLLAQLQNPLLAQLQNPLLQQAFQQHQPFGYPLQPQTLIGAGQYGIGQGIGQIHPLALQLALRQMSTPGISPWAGF